MQHAEQRQFSLVKHHPFVFRLRRRRRARVGRPKMLLPGIPSVCSIRTGFLRSIIEVPKSRWQAYHRITREPRCRGPIGSFWLYRLCALHDKVFSFSHRRSFPRSSQLMWYLVAPPLIKHADSSLPICLLTTRWNTNYNCCRVLLSSAPFLLCVYTWAAAAEADSEKG